MTLLQSFDNVLTWARVDDESGSIERVGALRGAALTARRTRANGWFSARADELLAFGVWRGELNAWVGERRIPVAGAVAAVDTSVVPARLRLERAGEETVVHEFTLARPPAVSRIDPTFDETSEDVDFPIWLATTISNPERLDHLRSEFRHGTKGDRERQA